MYQHWLTRHTRSQTCVRDSKRHAALPQAVSLLSSWDPFQGVERGVCSQMRRSEGFRWSRLRSVLTIQIVHRRLPAQWHWLYFSSPSLHNPGAGCSTAEAGLSGLGRVCVARAWKLRAWHQAAHEQSHKHCVAVIHHQAHDRGEGPSSR